MGWGLTPAVQSMVWDVANEFNTWRLVGPVRRRADDDFVNESPSSGECLGAIRPNQRLSQVSDPFLQAKARFG
jgi:hypothetical protein